MDKSKNPSPKEYLSTTKRNFQEIQGNIDNLLASGTADPIGSKLNELKSMLETKYFQKPDFSSGIGSDQSFTQLINHQQNMPKKNNLQKHHISQKNNPLRRRSSTPIPSDLVYDSSDFDNLENEIKYIQFKTEETTRRLREANRQITESTKAWAENKKIKEFLNRLTTYNFLTAFLLTWTTGKWCRNFIKLKQC